MKTNHPYACSIIHILQCAVQLDEKYLSFRIEKLNGFSHLCLIWRFDDCDNDTCRSIIDCAGPYVEWRSWAYPRRVLLCGLTHCFIHCWNLIDQYGWRAYYPYLHRCQWRYTRPESNPYTPNMDRIETPKIPKWRQKWPKSYEVSTEFDCTSLFSF